MWAKGSATHFVSKLAIQTGNKCIQYAYAVWKLCGSQAGNCEENGSDYSSDSDSEHNVNHYSIGNKTIVNDDNKIAKRALLFFEKCKNFFCKNKTTKQQDKKMQKFWKLLIC